ncbi:hypothetical protein, partial [Leifsonia sp. SIMBA_070]|uniref:hypothetical protein n=1 Tax=Leifsonia sp. SIMBA_070 TaxID=3085810 RepID=UPI0039790DD0
AELRTLEGPVWADPVYIPALGRSGFTRRHPIVEDGRYVGALIGLVTVGDLSAFLGRLEADLADWTPFVLDGAGRLIA